MRFTWSWEGRNLMLFILCTLSFSAVLSVGIFPYYCFLRWVWRLQHEALFLYSCIVSFFTCSLTSVMLLPLVKRLVGLRTPTGKFRITSWRAVLWGLSNANVLLARFLGMELLRCTPWINVYLMLMGAKIGQNVVVNSTYLYDVDLLEIGDNTVVGGDAVILGHSMENQWLHVARVKIGRNVTIGQSSTILAGSVIEDGAVIGAMSLVPKYSVVPRDSVWLGVPVERRGMEIAKDLAKLRSL
jgi:non-ribosomal peptide synthetase-like protein